MENTPATKKDIAKLETKIDDLAIVVNNSFKAITDQLDRMENTILAT